MKLPKPSAPSSSNGQNLLEIILVVAILGIFFAIGIPIGWNFYLNYQLTEERNTLVSVLGYARNLAMTNTNESDHGLFFTSDAFTVFEGSAYQSRFEPEDKTFPRSTIIQIDGPSEIIFRTLSGRTASSTYTLSDGSSRSVSVYVNTEGRMEY